jgi:phage FluMu protein Com
MAPKHHPTPLSGGDRKALNKELGKSRVNGGLPWLEIQCARCKTPSDVDLAAMKHPPTTFVHDLASRLRCRKCAKAGRRPSATLLQLAWRQRHPQAEV